MLDQLKNKLGNETTAKLVGNVFNGVKDTDLNAVIAQLKGLNLKNEKVNALIDALQQKDLGTAAELVQKLKQNAPQGVQEILQKLPL